MSGDAENGWQELWDSRAEALAKVFGKYDDTILHASVPFEMGQDVGGSPDVLSFPHHTDGVLYVTADLIGSDQRPNSEGQYELAVVHSAGDDWGISIICHLSYYTIDNVIEDGETMDIGEAAPSDSTITALFFRRIAKLNVINQKSNVICCVGLTREELDYKSKHGSEALIEKLGDDFVLTDMKRASKV